MGYSLITLWIPVRVYFIAKFEVLAISDELFPEFQGMFDPISKDIKRPIVRSTFFAIHDMYCNI